MEYEKIIKRVAETYDPDSVIAIAIENDTEVGGAHFILAKITYNGNDEMRVPFVIYDKDSVFMPRDWQDGSLPETADGIGSTEWVTYPSGNDAVILNGLPRIFTGGF